jgi:hypothetical protein
MWILFCLAYHLGIVSCNLATLGFTVECEIITVAKATESVRLGLQIQIPMSQTFSHFSAGFPFKNSIV